MNATQSESFNPPKIDLKQYIRSIPDYPKKGILFYDISTLLRNADAWQIAAARMANGVAKWNPDLVAGIESRGFVSASPLASSLGCGMIMIRKPGKLPGKTISLNYDLEYGQNCLHIQEDAVQPGQNVVVIDDLLATGGTLQASIELLRKVGANVVGAAALIELKELKGREKIDVPLHSVITYK
ncbi:adenine phosphoribosyltransferase [Commensalibacter nepenthis]|uniref:Adenine phosphoribosyltransferase n=1 Tax=Commensalibacter nepenthis TaxID=3043872 RepID=A0ABT6Q8Z6_9PROT|nr:adenine phosphoribosyltransferase [Commensalibacter sp. TBRC 10068]MDI2112815.1 adenine phosphoribosyltransferase [Commensalibacter sp. TBRC 10068]